MRPGWPTSIILFVILLSGCGRAPAGPVIPPSPPTPDSRPPTPIQFPRDEAPHDDLTEWWYYTGHLRAEDGRQFGFEVVFFQTVRGDYPVQYLGQFAITDRTRGSFQYASRTSQGSQIEGRDGFDLTIADWQMRGALGQDQIRASMDDYALSLELRTQKPAALHAMLGASSFPGLVSFGPAGDSYYYSYTRLAVEGSLLDHGLPLNVRGQAWFDHQWGNFLVLGGGWDWFSAQLDDGSELMLNHLRDDSGSVVGVWGTYVDPGGAFRSLDQTDFTIRPRGTWTSPKSGAAYPMGWNVSLRDPPYELRFQPVLEAQELASESRAFTYWEGANEVEGAKAGQPVRGQAYVELTGYAKEAGGPNGR